jgi:hypothetical protein
VRCGFAERQLRACRLLNVPSRRQPPPRGSVTHTSALVLIDPSGKPSVRWSEVIKRFVLYSALMTLILRGMDWLWVVVRWQPELESWWHAISFAFIWSGLMLALDIRRARRPLPHRSGLHDNTRSAP